MQISWVREGLPSIKERQAEKSKALSHAARFAHRRRQGQRQKERPDSAEKHGILPGYRSATQAEVSPRRKDLMLHPVARTVGLDEYRSIGLELSPHTKQVFEFLRSYYGASMFLTDGMASSPWITMSIATAVFQLTMSNLKDEIARAWEELPYGLAFAKLPGNEHLQPHLWECKAIVMQRARSVLEQTTTQTPIDTLVTPILHLFVAAVSDSNMDEASLHGSTLQALMLRKLALDGPSSFEITVMVYIISHDFQYSQVTSSYTNFDPDFWIPATISAATEPFSNYLKPFYESYTRQIQLTPRSSTLHEICVEVHEWLWLWFVEGHPQELLRPVGDPASIVRYFALEQAAFQARLSNHFVRVNRQLLKMHTTPRPSKTSLYLQTEAIISVSILAYLATFTGNPVFNKRPIWRKVEVFLRNLQSLLLGESEDSTSQRVDAEVLLFGYWIGATWEHGEEMDIEHRPQDWFSQGFVRESLRMSLRTWQSVKPVLDSICLSDFARPSGSLWVDNALREEEVPKLYRHDSIKSPTPQRAPS